MIFNLFKKDDGKNNEEEFSPISLIAWKKKIFLYLASRGEGNSEEKMGPGIFVASGKQADSLKLHKTAISLKERNSEKDFSALCDLKFLAFDSFVYLFFVDKRPTGVCKNVPDWKVAVSEDGVHFRVIGQAKNLNIEEPSVFMPTEKGEGVLAGGVGDISLFKFKSPNLWKDRITAVSPRHGYFDHSPIRAVALEDIGSHHLLLYESRDKIDDTEMIKIGGVLLSKENPFFIVWRSEFSLFDFPVKRGERCLSVRATVTKDKVTLFFLMDSGEIRFVDAGNIILETIKNPEHKELVKRFKANPVLSPLPHNKWEAVGVFNPAVVKIGRGFHMIYRAIGDDGVSRLGYAYSKDGVSFKDRHEKPIFAIKGRHELEPGKRRPDPVMYPSGGSWGGCEDPRMVRIEGRVYLTFNAFDGWDYIRIGLSSIDERDLVEKSWDWDSPLILSPKGQINKNWVLFPEKIKGKFAILHSISPEIQIDYVGDLKELASGKKTIKSNFGNKIPRNSWDTWVRGAGPPPIKIKEGWLLLYHAIGKTEPTKYKLGAMILDAKDPTKVIARSSTPILLPNMWYENDSKPGVVYSCGAVLDKDVLYVYYGGGDKYVCVGTVNIKDLVKHVIDKKEISLKISNVEIS